MAITFTDYAFDVMWKDELTASVSITNNRKNIEVKNIAMILPNSLFGAVK